MKKLVLLILLLLSVIGYSQAADAISVNFTYIGSDAAGSGWGYHDTIGRSSLSLAGYAVTDNWNEVYKGTNTTVVSNLLDSSGNPTTAIISLNNDVNYGISNNIDAAPHELAKNACRIANSDIKHTASEPKKELLRIEGIPYSEYTVVAYLFSTAAGRTGEISVGATSYYYTSERSFEIEQRFIDGLEPWVEATHTTAGDYSQVANVAVFPGQTDSTCVVLFDAVSDNTGIAGIQIIENDGTDWPDPYRGQPAVSVTKTLSWNPPVSFVPSGYDVYIDPNETLVNTGDLSVRVAAAQTGESYTPASVLLYDTTYYWRVDAIDPNDGNPMTIAGFPLSFTTDVHPSTLEPQLYAPGITIGNPSFEKESAWSAATSDWFDNGGAYQEPVVPTPYGTVLGCAEPSGTFWQPIGTLQHNTDYVISWGVSKRPGYSDGGTKASLWYVNPASVPADQSAGDATTPSGIGATKIGETAVYTSGVDNQFVEVSETINTGTGGVDNTDTLLVQVVNGLGSGRGYFDMVRVNLPRDPRSVWGPTPLNGAEGIAPSAPLAVSWNMGVDPATNYQPLTNVVKYHVYFGADPAALVYQGESTTETLTITPAMTEFTKHYWRVDQVLSDGSVITGPTWEITASLSDRLIAHWKFEGNLDDEVTDLTGNAAGDWPGTMNDPNFEAGGLDGQALRFYRGDGRFLTIEGSEDFFNFYSTGLTVNMWYKADDYAGIDGYMGLMSKTGGQNNDGWKLFESAYYGNQGAYMAIDKVNVNPAGRLDDGNWHMLTITYDETAKMMTAYVDGELDGTAEGAVTSGTANKVVIGALTDGGAWELRGLIDEVKIYSYAQSPLEVAVEYTNLMDGETVCPYPDDPSLQYDFNGNCKVDLGDFVTLAENWAACNIVPTCIQ